MVDIAAMKCARLYGHDVADSWLVKDGISEANEVMESGNEFHSLGNSPCDKRLHGALSWATLKRK